jgi:hypothetical protein
MIGFCSSQIYINYIITRILKKDEKVQKTE